MQPPPKKWCRIAFWYGDADNISRSFVLDFRTTEPPSGIIREIERLMNFATPSVDGDPHPTACGVEVDGTENGQ